MQVTQNQVIEMLERAALPSHIRLNMRKYPSKHKIKENHIHTLKIEHFFSKENVSDMLKASIKRKKLNLELEKTILPRTDEDDLISISNEASLYFRQSLAMYKNLLLIDDVASPLVEYYSFLQCVKGALILAFNFNKEIFFSYHGLTPIYPSENQKDQNYYIKANAKPGILLALILMSSRSYQTGDGETIWTMDEFLQKDFQPSLKEILDRVEYIDSDKYIPLNFMCSWMLSTFVRYKPLDWKEIIDGSKDDIFIKIQNFRRNKLPRTYYNILSSYIDISGIFPEIERSRSII